MDKPTSWPWDPAPTSSKFYRVRGQQPPAGEATRRTLAFGIGAFRPPPAPATAADTHDDVSAELAQVCGLRAAQSPLNAVLHHGLTLSRQLRGSILGPSPPWGTFTDAFAGAELIASRSAEDVSTLQQGTAPPCLRAADSLTHSGVMTQEQDALLEVTSGASGDMKRRRFDASELTTASDPLSGGPPSSVMEWQFDGGTTTLTHEEITIDTDMDGGVRMIAVVGSLTAEEGHGAPAVLRAFTGSANIYLPRPDSPRGPHDWDEAMLTAYPEE